MSTAWSKDMVLDPGTFGGTRACHVLVDMMNNNAIPVFEKHRVLAFLTDANTQFKWVSTIKHKPVMERNMDLMLHHLIDRIQEFTYPAKFKSYMKNVVTHMYRKNLEAWRE